jgi:hypothetical protein
MSNRSLFGTIAANFDFEVPINPTEPTEPTTPNGSIVPTVDPGQDITQAYDLGVLTDSLIVQESLGGNDSIDGYQFTVSTPGEYSVTLNGLSADADLGIVDSNGQLIASSETSGIAEEILSGTLNAGTYHLVVASIDGEPTDYTLSLTNINVSNPTIPTDPGDTLDTASNLGIFDGDNSVTIQETVGSSDVVDLYQFSLDRSNDFSVTLEGLSADADLYLLDVNGEIVATSENIDATAEGFSGMIEGGGTFFLGVVSYDGIDTSYDLTLSTGSAALSSLEVDFTADALAISDEFSLA